MERLDKKVIWLFTVQQFGFGKDNITNLLRGFAIQIGIVWWILLIFPELNTGPQIDYGKNGIPIIGFFAPIFFLIPSYIWATLRYKFYSYELSENTFKKEYGVIRKRYVSIPYGKIQNIDIQRGLLARILGLSELQIHTAGVGKIPKPEGKLPGISPSEAEILRDSIMKKVI